MITKIFKVLKVFRMLVPFRRHYKIQEGVKDINILFTQGWKPTKKVSALRGLVMHKRKLWWED